MYVNAQKLDGGARQLCLCPRRRCFFMRLVRAHEVWLKSDGDKVMASAGGGGERVEGFGPDVPAALEDLVRSIRTGGNRGGRSKIAKGRCRNSDARRGCQRT